MKSEDGEHQVLSPWSSSPRGPAATSASQSTWRRWVRLLASFRPRTHEPTTMTVTMPATVAAIMDSSSIQRITLMLGSSLMWTMLAVLGRRRHSVEHTARLLFFVSLGAFVGVLSCTLRMTRPHGSIAVNASVVVRGFTTAFAFAARFMSLIHLRIVDSAALTSMAPVLAGLPTMAGSTTRRPVWFVFSLTCLVTAMGLLLYQDEGMGSQRLQSFGWAFLSACLVAGQEFFAHTTKDIPQGVLLLHSSFTSLLFSTLLAGNVLESPKALLTKVDMGEMSMASQTAFAYVFFVSKARETDQGLANMYKYAMDVLMACALTWTFLPEDAVPTASYGAAVFVLCAVVTAEVQRLHHMPRPAPGGRVRMRFFM
ncbi:uncharacterized protein [Dermacentor andersoni]|uniref:uncharacterized protein n=1 Tax=Dermacentor andersoni TaxID=34620 RepID=UPI0024164DB8|nr:uncharacterized protein LOC129383007 [Dermacentor andersoni]